MKASEMQPGGWYRCDGNDALFEGEYQAGDDGYFLVRIDGLQDGQSMLFLNPTDNVEPLPK
jgi:hypothetical protein